MSRPLAAVALVAVFASRAFAQTPPSAPAQSPTPSAHSEAIRYPAYRYRLLGVYDEASGSPIEGAVVEDMLTGVSSVTSSTGTMSLFFLPDGGSMVRIKKLGFGVQTLTIGISPADTAPVTVVLPHATELPTVVVKDSAPVRTSAMMTSFETHRKQGFGQFITADELRKADNQNMANVLASKLTGLMSRPGRLSSTFLVSTRKTCSGRALNACHLPDCYVTVYTNGIKTFDYTSLGTAPGAENLIPDFARLNVSDYGAVEFYAGGAILPEGVTPTNSDCGVLMLWTREK